MTSNDIQLPKNRLDFLDNLRTFMIFLVVLYHSGMVYESTGMAGFFWIVYDFSTNPLVDNLNLIMDICIMAVIFFISGYLTPHSLNNKTGGEFIKSKFKRLMIPWVIAVFTLMPLYKIIFLYSRNMPQQAWTSYFHFSNGHLSQNWLWFLPVLFAFNLLTLGIYKMRLNMPKFSFKIAVGIVFIVALIYSIFMDIEGLQGWTKTPVIDFQNDRLLLYFMLFLLGAFGYKQTIFNSNSNYKRLTGILLCTVWIPIYYYRLFTFNETMNPAIIVFSENMDSVLRWLSFHVSLLGLMFLLINIFRIYLNKQGKISKFLNANSYNVYIIHNIVLGGIAIFLLKTDIPSILKFIMLTIATYILSNTLVTLYRYGIKARLLAKLNDKS